jgi:Flp pilus assembly protein TadB
MFVCLFVCLFVVLFVCCFVLTTTHVGDEGVSVERLVVSGGAHSLRTRSHNQRASQTVQSRRTRIGGEAADDRGWGWWWWWWCLLLFVDVLLLFLLLLFVVVVVVVVVVIVVICLFVFVVSANIWKPLGKGCYIEDSFAQVKL